MAGQGKTVGQMKAEAQVWADQQEIVTSCDFTDCDWRFTGPAVAGRERAAAHRLESHPELRPRSISEIQRQRKQEDAKMAEEAKQRRVREERWPAEKIVVAFQAFAKKHKRPPTTGDANDPTLPSQTTVAKRFGTWGNGIVAAGFPRPVRGRRAGDERLAEPRPRLTVTRGEREDKIVVDSGAEGGFESRVRTLVKGVLDEVEAEAILASRDIREAAAEIIRDALHSLTEEAA